MEDFLKGIIKEAGAIAMKYYGKVKVKYVKDHPTDWVTKADLEINHFLSTKIKERYPDHGIISEEEDEYQTDAEYLWTIDPIDGTVNFASNIPLFAVMVGLFKKKELHMAAINLPVSEEVFFAEKNKGAFLNDRKISCSQKEDWLHSAASIGTDVRPEKEIYWKFLPTLMKKGSFWRSSYGSIGVSGAYVAAGRRDWNLTSGGRLWDYAPTALLLREAGCKVTDFSGKDWEFGDDEFLGANPILHAKLLKELKEFV